MREDNKILKNLLHRFDVKSNQNLFSDFVAFSRYLNFNRYNKIHLSFSTKPNCVKPTQTLERRCSEGSMRNEYFKDACNNDSQKKDGKP